MEIQQLLSRMNMDCRLKLLATVIEGQSCDCNSSYFNRKKRTFPWIHSTEVPWITWKGKKRKTESCSKYN